MVGEDDEGEFWTWGDGAPGGAGGTEEDVGDCVKLRCDDGERKLGKRGPVSHFISTWLLLLLGRHGPAGSSPSFFLRFQ